MVYFKSTLNLNQKATGFTLVELVMVIVLLGVMAVGITGFMGLTTQTYLNVSERDELVSSARFAIERLNRELRNAVPNSVRVKNQSGFNCVEFVPILASTTYVDIPVAPEPASNQITVIPFKDSSGNDYSCNSFCQDAAVVYPLNISDVYDNPFTNSGKIFGINSVNYTVPTQWTITLDQSGQFSADSPNQRIYIVKSPVSYCVYANKLYRFDNYSLNSAVYITPFAFPALMAENIATTIPGSLPFEYIPQTLQRNALLQIRLHFIKNNEDYVFNDSIHLQNVP